MKIADRIRSLFTSEPEQDNFVHFFCPVAESDIVSFDLQVGKNPQDDAKNLYRLFLTFYHYEEGHVVEVPTFIYATHATGETYQEMALAISKIKKSGVIPTDIGIKTDGTVMSESGQFLYSIDWKEFPNVVQIKKGR